jgi:hypothetical protein
MKFSTLAAVITALVASSSALPAPVELREDLIDNVSKNVASNPGRGHENHLDKIHVRRDDLTGTIENNGNENLNDNLDGLLVEPRDGVTVSLTGNGDKNLNHNLPRGLIGGILDGTLNNDANANHPKALVRPVVQPNVKVPRHELTELLNGDVNENKPTVLVRPIVQPKVHLPSVLGERDILHDILNGDVNGNKPKVLVRPVVQPKLNGIPRSLKEVLSDDLNVNGNGNKPKALVRPAVAPNLEIMPVVTPRSEELNDDFHNNGADIAIPELSHAPEEVLSGDANGNGNGNEPMLFVRPAVAPKLALAPVITPRGLRDLLSGDLNGNLNGNMPKGLIRPAVAPKLTVAPVVAPRSEALSDKLSDNKEKITVDNKKLALPELPFAEHEPRALKEKTNVNNEKLALPELPFAEHEPRALKEKINVNNEKLALPEHPFAEHEPRALKEILSGDLNTNGNGNKPQALVRPAVAPKITVKPVVAPRSEELNDIDEKIAFPELFVEHEPRALRELLAGDLNGNANGNRPEALVRPAVAPKVVIKPVLGARAEELDNFEEEVAMPESLFAHGRPAFPSHSEHGTLSGDANGNLNGNEPKLLLRPAVAPKIAVEPVVGPRAEGLDNMEEGIASPELLFGHGRPTFSADNKHGTLSGDANGNLNGNEPKLLVRPAVAPKIAVEPVVGPRATSGLETSRLT